jgi:hypothetical protein
LLVEAGLAVFAEILVAGFADAFGLALFGAALLEALAFLVFGSAFEAALEEAFFGAAFAFANLTSRQFFDFGNY